MPRRYHTPRIPGRSLREMNAELECLREEDLRRGTVAHILGNDNSSKIKEHSSFIEEYCKDLEKEQHALKRNQIQVQAGTEEVLQKIYKLGDSIVESFETPPEYPIANLFERWNEAQNNAALIEELRTSMVNQAKCIYGLSVLERLAKTNIPNNPKFEKVLHSLNALKDQISQKTETEEAAKKCAQQYRQARYLQDLSAGKWQPEIDKQDRYIQSLNNDRRLKLLPENFLAAGKVKVYADQNETRIEELEHRQKHFETYLQENEAKLGRYQSQIEKRASAVAKSMALSHRIDNLRVTSLFNAAQSGTMTTAVDSISENNAMFTAAANRIILGTLVVTAYGIANVTNTTILSYRRLSDQARMRSEEAARRVEEAKKWTEEAERRSRIAEAYGLDGEPAKNTMQHARQIEELEQQVASAASLTESYTRQIQNSVMLMAENAQKMQNIVNGAGGVTRITPGQKNQLQELRDEIEKAEKSINIAITFYKQSARSEQTAAQEVSNAFPNLLTAVGNERPIETAITNQANLDWPFLQAFIHQQRAFVDILKNGTPAIPAVVGVHGGVPAIPSLIDLEKAFADTTWQIEEAIRAQRNIGGPGGLKATAQAHVANIKHAQVSFHQALLDFQVAERNAAAVCKRNAIYTGQDIESDTEQAVKYLQDIEHEHTLEVSKAEDDKSFLHFALDPLTGKFTIGQKRKVTVNDVEQDLDERIYIDAKEIWSMTRLDENRTEIKYRPDLTEISLNQFSRDGGGGRAEHKRKIPAKRLEQQDFTGKGYHAIVAVPGNDFTTTESRREKGYVIIQNRKQGDNGYTQPDVLNNLNFKAIYDGTSNHRTYLDAMIHAANVAAGVVGAVAPAHPPVQLSGMAAVDAVIAYLEDRNNGFGNTITVKKVDMSTCPRIAITENLINEKGDIEVGSEVTAQTRPIDIIYHDVVEAARATMTAEEKRHMWGINLKKEVFRMCDTGVEIPIKVMDFTETKFYPETGGPAIGSGGGPTFRFNGPPELCWINLHALGTSIFLSEIWNEAVALEEKADHNFQETIKFLQQAVQQKDKDKIEDAIRMVGFLAGTETASIGKIQQELQKPPKDSDDWNDLRKKKKAEKAVRPSNLLKSHMKSANVVLKRREACEKSIEQRIRDINEDQLLNSDIRMSHIDPVKHSLEKRRMSKKKRELFDEIHKAHHLHKRIRFVLLEDPKQGPPSPPAVVPATGSQVKNNMPNGLELLEEYLLWKGHDLSNMTAAQRQRVARYVADIAHQFERNSAIPDSYRNAYRIIRALEEARKRNFPQANSYIADLEQGPPPLRTDDSIAALIRSDEYYRIKYIKDSLHETGSKSVQELIIPALAMADWAQQGSFNNIKQVFSILDPETSSKKAKEMLGKLQDNIPSILQPIPELDTQEKARVDIKDKDKSDLKEHMSKKSDSDLSQDTEKIITKISTLAQETVQSLVDSTDDVGLKNKYRDAAQDLYKELAKNHVEIWKRKQDERLMWQKWDAYCKRQDQLWLKDCFRDLAFLWMKNIVNFESKAAQTLLSELLKLAQASIRA